MNDRLILLDCQVLDLRDLEWVMEYGVFLTGLKELEIVQDFLGVFFGSVPTGLLVLKNWRTCLISISAEFVKQKMV